MIIPKEGSIDVSADARAALGASSDCVNVLCCHANIKMWSRMKPVRIANGSPSRTGRWWEGDAGNCGIDATGASSNSYSGVPSLYTSDLSNGYVYERPYGGNSAPYRIADFRGYDTDAVPPVLDFVVTERVSKTGAAIMKAQYAPSTPDYDLDAPGSLTLGEIGGFTVNGHSADLGDLYFGIVIMQGGSIKKYQTTPSAGTTEVEVSVADLQTGFYTAYPFFCSVQQDGKMELSGKYYSLPNVGPKDFEVIETNVNIEVEATWHYKSNSHEKDYLTYEVYVLQNVSSSLYLGNNTVRLRYTRNSDGAALETYEYTQTMDNIRVTSGTRTLVGSGTFSGPFNPNEIYNLRISLHGGVYKQNIIPREDFNPIH